jgi:glycosyltransferase involved in cell wall biosynthesis
VTVSVVIPVFNQADSIARTIEAVAAQTLSPVEIVVVDDGSRDGSAEAAEALRETVRVPIKVVRSAVNRGPGAARDLGWRAAAGDIVAFTDADAVPDPEWLGMALPHFQDPHVGGVEGRVTAIGDEAPTIYTHQVKNLYGGQFMTANMLYRRQVIAEVGGFKSRYREDSDLAFSVMEAGYRIVFEPRAVVEHPPRPESLAFYFHKANRRRYEGLLLRRHPQVAPRYIHWLQPTDITVILGEAGVVAGFAAGLSSVIALGLLLLLVGLPRRIVAWLDGRQYSLNDYLVVLAVSLVLVPVEAYYRWSGLLFPPKAHVPPAAPAAELGPERQ